jgi:hypothetical protein
MTGVVIAALSLLASPARADQHQFSVTLTAEGLVVRAERAPLCAVLARLAAVAKAEIVGEASLPCDQVTVDLGARRPGDAVLALLEGRGLNFGLAPDPNGRGLKLVLVSDRSLSVSPAAAVPSAELSRELPLPEKGDSKGSLPPPRSAPPPVILGGDPLRPPPAFMLAPPPKRPVLPMGESIPFPITTPKDVQTVTDPSEAAPSGPGAPQPSRPDRTWVKNPAEIPEQPPK